MITITTHALNRGENIIEDAVHFDLRHFHQGKRFRVDVFETGLDLRLQKKVAADHRYEAIQHRVISRRKKERNLVFKCWDGLKLSVAVGELIAKALYAKGEQTWIDHQQLNSTGEK